MVNEGKKDFEFKKAPDGSYSIDGKSAPKPEEKKEPKFDSKGTPTPEQPSAEFVSGATPDSNNASKEKEVPEQPLNKPAEEASENETAEEKKVVRKLETGSDKKESAEYKSAREEWLSARERSNTLKTEYNQKYEAYLQEQAKENSFKKGWRATRKWLGLKPQLSEELVKLGHAAEIARRDHFEASNKIKEIRLGGIETATKAVREGRPVNESSREITVGQIDDVEKLMDRYGKMLSYKLVISPRKEQLAIQEGVADSFPESPASKRIKSSLEAMRKYRYVRWGATAVGYGVLAGATGGLGVAVLVGGGYLARVGGGAIIGSYAGTMFRKAGENLVADEEKKLSAAESQVGRSLFERGYTETDAEIEKLTRSVEIVKAATRTGSAAAAVGFGFLGGSVTGEIADNIEFSSGGKPGTIDTSNPPVKAGMGPDGKTAPLKEMGDASVAEKMYPDVKEAFNKDGVTAPREITPGAPNHAGISGGGEAIPQGNEEHIGPDHEPDENGIEDYEHEEDVFDEPAVTHTIKSGETGWGTMKTHSSVLEDLPLAEQNKWQIKLWDSLTPQEAMDAGFVKSGGDVDKVYPGEIINVSMLDQRLTELMQQESGDIPIPTPRPEDVVSGEPVTIEEAPANESIVNKLKDSLSDMAEKTISETGATEAVNWTNDINAMSVGDILSLHDAVEANNPEVMSKLQEFGYDKDTYMELNKVIAGQINPNGGNSLELTLTDWMKRTEVPPVESVIPNDSTPRNELQPDIDPRGETDSLSNDTNRFREASFTPEAANDNSEAVQGYVNRVEGGGGLFDWAFGNNKVGTFEKIADLNFGQIKEYAVSGKMEAVIKQLGVTQEGYEKWMSELQSEVAKTPALSDSETLRQYLARINTVQVAA